MACAIALACTGQDKLGISRHTGAMVGRGFSTKLEKLVSTCICLYLRFFYADIHHAKKKYVRENNKKATIIINGDVLTGFLYRHRSRWKRTKYMNKYRRLFHFHWHEPKTFCNSTGSVGSSATHRKRARGENLYRCPAAEKPRRSP